VVAAFANEIREALDHPADFKSMLQERLARRGDLVAYEVTGESGPPHDRVFEVAAVVGGRHLGHGSGRSKKDAEQHAAAAALEDLRQSAEAPGEREEDAEAAV
jgi:ribonuclease III